MPGIITDHFSTLQQDFLHKTDCIVCPSALFQSYFQAFSKKNTTWFTFDRFTEWLVQQLPDTPHVVTPNELILLGYHSDISSNDVALAAELRRLNWITPEQLLKHPYWMNFSHNKRFRHCLLLGITSRDDIRFAPILKAFAEEVSYIAFDPTGDALAMYEMLEKQLGEAIFCFEEKHDCPQTSFHLIEGDASSYVTQRCANIEGRTAIVCGPKDAARIVHRLKKTYVSEFSVPTLDNFTVAWLHWQRTEQLEAFVDVYIAWQRQQSQKIPIRELLAEALERCPTRNLQRLSDTLPQVQDFLKIYPLLPEKGFFRDFVDQTKALALQMPTTIPTDYPITKSAFLDFVEQNYQTHTPIDFESSLFILTASNAQVLTFEHIFAFLGEDNLSLSELASLHAQQIDFIAEQSTPTFAILYQQITGETLSSERISEMTVHTSFQGNRLKFPELRAIHQERNDSQSTQSAFAYTIEKKVRLPATAIEQAYTHPEAVWYRYILKTPPIAFDLEPQKLTGILTHQLLNFKKNLLPDFETMCHLIQMSSDGMKHFYDEAVTNALRIAEKLGTITEYPYLTSEINLQAPLCLSDGTEIPIYGRVDAILSKKPFRNNFHPENTQNDLILIDYKTGATSTKDLKKLAKKYTRLPDNLTGFQLVLYGWILRTMNYKNIQLLILNPDPYAPLEPILLDSILDGDNQLFLEHYLRSLLIDGVFGYELQSPFVSYSFVLPVAEIAPAKEILHAQKITRLWDPIFSEQK